MNSTNPVGTNPVSKGRRWKKPVALVGALALVVGGAGIAFAYWTSAGTGTGSAETGESVALVVTSETPAGTIAPGSAGQTVEFTVTNPGPGTQALSEVTVTMADANGVAWVPTGACLIADYSATITTEPVYGSIAATEFVSGTVTVTLANTGVNQDDCQNQEVPLYFVAA